MGQGQGQSKPPARPGQSQGQQPAQTAEQKPTEQKPTEQKPQTAAEKKMAKKMRSIELAEKRTAIVLEKIRLLGNLASPNYALTAEHKKQIVDAIANAGAELESRFEQSYTAAKTSWHFE